jgi:opacity protein-like surface antigen
MKQFVGLIALIFLSSHPLMAQGTPKFEIGGGYSYLKYYGANNTTIGMNGWIGSVDFNFKRWLGVAGDFSGNYKNQGLNGDTSIYTAVVGPRVYPFGHKHRLTIYGHMLFGAGYININIPANGGFPPTTKSSTSFTFDGGGGVDWRIKKNWAVRLPQFDLVRTHFFSSNISQNNLRVAVGLVYHFGEK